MHDQTEYGVLRWPLREIAKAVGCKLSELRTLVSKQVLKGVDDGQRCEAFVYTPRSGRKDGEPVTLVAEQEGPIWYSSRMVKDEYVRTIRGESTRFGDGGGDTPKRHHIRAPKPPLGDGSSASSSASAVASSSLRSEEVALTGKPKRPKRRQITLGTYIDDCKAAGRKPLPPDHPIRDYCAAAGITDEMVQVAWCVFRDEHTSGTKKDKRYVDWPGHFANAVRGGWMKLWFHDGNEVKWSSRGMQEKLVLDAKARAREEQPA
jgi:hypothetical protein